MSSGEMSFRSRSSVAMNSEEAPLEKNASLVPTFSSLPDDMVLSCLAYVSRLYYPTLSLVSKKFRSLLASPEIYEVRSLLGRTENCLYICLRFSPDSDPRWYTLCKNPNRNLTHYTGSKNKKPSAYMLSPIPNLDSPKSHWEGVVAVGSHIYSIGESSYTDPLSSVSVLDCKSHIWHKAPSMRVKRFNTKANVFDGKIYVVGGCKDNPLNLMEVFDPKTQTWELASSSPLAESYIWEGAVVEGEIYFERMRPMIGEKRLVYKPKEDKWEVMEGLNNLVIGCGWRSFCVIDNSVLYSYDWLHGIQWYDSNARNKVNLQGLKGLPKIPQYSRVKLVAYGEKLVVLWDKKLPSSSSEYKQKRMILCAVIALERRNNNREIWGNIEWLDAMLTVPKSYEFLGAAVPAV